MDNDRPLRSVGGGVYTVVPRIMGGDVLSAISVWSGWFTAALPVPIVYTPTSVMRRAAGSTLSTAMNNCIPIALLICIDGRPRDQCAPPPVPGKIRPHSTGKPVRKGIKPTKGHLSQAKPGLPIQE